MYFKKKQYIYDFRSEFQDDVNLFHKRCQLSQTGYFLHINIQLFWKPDMLKI